MNTTHSAPGSAETADGMHIELDVELCEGHAQCEMLAPDYFEVSDEGRAHLLRDTVAPGDHALLTDVALRCPVVAIRLRPTS